MRIALDSTRTGRQAEQLGTSLRRLIVGQDEAIAQIVSVYQTHVAGLTPPNRPIGSFLFLGPTGSGKTRIVEATAESLVGTARAVMKIDCGEFQHSHEIAKLMGSPPGYLGHRETSPMLSQENLDRFHTSEVPISFVLFDEVEKASDALWNLLLGVLDKAVLTLGDNRHVDFSRAMIFMTSNVGASEMTALVSPRLGFAAPQDTSASPTKLAETGTAAARRKFTPEFLNRLDKIAVFKSLGETELRRVLSIELEEVQQRVLASCGVPFGFSVSEAANKRVLEEGTDARYGARHLKRAIDRLIVFPISNLVASGQLEAGDWLYIDTAASGELAFNKEPHRLPATALPAAAGVPFERPARMSPASALRKRVAAAGRRIDEIGFGE